MLVLFRKFHVDLEAFAENYVELRYYRPPDHVRLPDGGSHYAWAVYAVGTILPKHNNGAQDFTW